MQTRRNQRNPKRGPKLFRSLGIHLLVYALLILSTSAFLSAAVFYVPAGDVPGLIAAINAANANGEENTIILDAGTYTLTTVDNNVDGPNGLPSITSTLTIKGAGAQSTIIQRDPIITLFQEPMFRIIHVAIAGNLTLERLAIKGGHARFEPQLEERRFGGGLLNKGSVNISDCIFSANRADYGGGVHTLSGTVEITRSTLTGNTSIFGQGAGFGSGGSTTRGSVFPGGKTVFSNSLVVDNEGSGVLNFHGDVSVVNSSVAKNTGSGLENYEMLTVADSAIFDNFKGGNGGGVFNLSGKVNISNTTIVRNTATSNGGGVYADNLAGGTVAITNSTVSENTAQFSQGGGLFLEHEGVQLQNTIVADNIAPFIAPFIGADCGGSVASLYVSLGNNLIGDPTGCRIGLQPSDRTGDAGLGAFVDPGTPGAGRVPLLTGSQAIDAGNDAACPPTDQLGTPRNGSCDIGALEFYPVVNDLVALANITTAFDITPVPDGPAGTFRISAEFINTSNQAIIHPFVEVVELTGESLLLNADGGAGGVGARLTLPDSAKTPFQPAGSSTFEFLIGLQQREPFTFFVNMLGEPQTPSPFVSRR